MFWLLTSFLASISSSSVFPKWDRFSTRSRRIPRLGKIPSTQSFFRKRKTHKIGESRPGRPGRKEKMLSEEEGSGGQALRRRQIMINCQKTIQGAHLVTQPISLGRPLASIDRVSSMEQTRLSTSLSRRYKEESIHNTPTWNRNAGSNREPAI